MSGKKQAPKWARFIMGQALAEFDGKNREAVLAKVESTALAVRPDLMKTFRELLDRKEKFLEGQ